MSVEIRVVRDPQWPGWWLLTVDGAEPVQVNLRRVREAIDGARATGDDVQVVWPEDLDARLKRKAAADHSLESARRESEESRLSVVDYLVGDGPAPMEKNSDIGALLGVSQQRAGVLVRKLMDRRQSGPKEA
ncbi:hypothetical protein [Tsukamurella spumae]|uniref:Uncharacterized protein n=1 Tax=Tsukamurella spumae TaxID=44753 RepID=A0A846X5J0_9ACTN|nr:hypothetical protein [Tsukamurella spumae]NKY19452.1 hypothetical protein [Tsukamurella spumae]